MFKEIMGNNLSPSFEDLDVNDGYYYHVSASSRIKTLKPQDKTEDYTSTGKKKLCLADTIYGCIVGIMLPNTDFPDSIKDEEPYKRNGDTYRAYVYRVPFSDIDRSKIEDKTNDTNEEHFVFDQLLTGEIAYTGELKAELMGEINITVLPFNKVLDTFGIRKIFFNISVLSTDLRHTFHKPMDGYKIQVIKSDILTYDSIQADKLRFKERLKEVLKRSIKITQYNFSVMKREYAKFK